MAQHKEHLWQAYIDGQLSAAEASEFEESLTPEERELLAADVCFERRLGERLSQPLGIPQDVWDRTLTKLDAAREAESPTPTRRVGAWLWGAVSLAAAAMIAFGILGHFPAGDALGPPSIVMAAEDVGALEAGAETEATVESVSAFLQARGIAVDLSLDLDGLYAVHAQGHRLRFLGAGSERFGTEDVAELYFDCCSSPEKVLIVKRDSEAAAALKRAFGRNGDVQAIRDAGDYLVAVVGVHPAHDLLDTVGTSH